MDTCDKGYTHIHVYIHTCTYIHVHVFISMVIHVYCTIHGYRAGYYEYVHALSCLLTLLASFFLPSHLSFKNMYK